MGDGLLDESNVAFRPIEKLSALINSLMQSSTRSNF